VRLSPALSWAPLSRSNGRGRRPRSATGIARSSVHHQQLNVVADDARFDVTAYRRSDRQALLTMLPMSAATISGRYATRQITRTSHSTTRPRESMLLTTFVNAALASRTLDEPTLRRFERPVQ